MTPILLDLPIYGQSQSHIGVNIRGILPTMKLRAVLAERLAYYMARKFDIESENKLAKKSGVSQSSINRICNGTQPATIDKIEMIAKAVGVPPSDLLTLDVPKTAASDDEVKLIDAWRQLNEQNKTAVMGFIHVCGVMDTVDHRGALLHRSGPGEQVPPQQAAAIKRESARRPGTDTQHPPATDEQPTRRKGRKA